MTNISSAPFKNRFVGAFSGVMELNTVRRNTYGVLYSLVTPTPVSSPRLISWSDDLGKSLNVLRPLTDEDLGVLSGNFVSKSMTPYAACYGGHQFGYWSGQLGDGRAITLGELHFDNNLVQEIQLKGAGPTPYSRHADGRAVLRSSVREYLMSEAMYYLNVPTTRALSLVVTGDTILRDMFYDGNPEYEPGAIVTRVAPSFLRFGNFEILSTRGEIQNLEQLTNWTIDNYFEHVKGNGEERIKNWFREVSELTAKLIVDWLRVGFVHGVMNTDNMSILGLTIDYGPFSMLDQYDPSFTPNTTDLPGRRYSYAKQASIALWNLEKLADALSLIIEDRKSLKSILTDFETYFSREYYAMIGNKLGLDEIVSNDDYDLVKELDQMLTALEIDMTIFFTQLETYLEGIDFITHFESAFYKDLSTSEFDRLKAFLSQYLARVERNKIQYEESRELMRKANPRFILRNYLLHQAIEKLEQGDESLFRELEEQIKTPYSSCPKNLSRQRPDWAKKKAGCSMLSCSS